MTSALARDLYPWIRARIAMPLPFSPSAGVTSPFTANATVYIAPVGWECTPMAFYAATFVAATNNALNYWTITLNIIYAGVATSQGSVTTAAITAGQWEVLPLSTFTTSPWDLTSNATVAGVSITKTGAPGALYLAPSVYVI